MKAEYVWVVVILLFGGYEVYALLTPRTGDTVSELMWRHSNKLALPFLLGALAGHFWLQRSFTWMPFTAFGVGLVCGYALWQR